METPRIRMEIRVVVEFEDVTVVSEDTFWAAHEGAKRGTEAALAERGATGFTVTASRAGP